MIFINVTSVDPIVIAIPYGDKDATAPIACPVALTIVKPLLLFA
ncbi:MAG: hypothetical protein ABL911_12700 [Gallionella sp.]